MCPPLRYRAPMDNRDGTSLPEKGDISRAILEGWARAPNRPGGLRAAERLSADERVLTILDEDRCD